ncbi:MAG: MoxR family ATPase [Phycisphaerales bacterium]|nr:MoxR family ATPase [Phycisphaerales bacterium]
MTDQNPETTPAVDIESASRTVKDAYERIRSEVHKVIVGQEEVLEQATLSMFCGGHAVVEGVPGLAKTLLISTLAKTLSLGFSRIQFTPDLMPSDMTGTEVIEEDKTTGTRNLRFVKGPIFANVVLADEINRTPPKTQAALLEAMQERQVTAGGVRHELPRPFFVLATQNPIEQEGTYPLPEAQLDRFMFNIRVKYPTEEQELEIIKQTTTGQSVEPEPVLDAKECLEIQELIRAVPIADHVAQYALRLVRATRVRNEESEVPQIVKDYLSWGAGPRASQFLVIAAKAKAILSGSTHVMPSHIQSIALPVLRHRIITNFNAEADGVRTDDVITSLLETIPLDASDSMESKQIDSVVN